MQWLPSAENAPQWRRVDVVTDMIDESGGNLVTADTGPVQPPTCRRDMQTGDDKLTRVGASLGPLQRERAGAGEDAVRPGGDVREGGEPTAPHGDDLFAAVERGARKDEGSGLRVQGAERGCVVPSIGRDHFLRDGSQVITHFGPSLRRERPRLSYDSSASFAPPPPELTLEYLPSPSKLISSVCAVDDLSGANRVLHRRQRFYVLRRVASQDGKVRLITGGDSRQLFGLAKSIGG